MPETKLYCVWRSDLVCPVGKMMAQAGHAFVNTVEQARLMGGGAPRWELENYLEGAQPKIVLGARDTDELMAVLEAVMELKIAYHVVTDEGRTVFPEPTLTCVGFGPVERESLPGFIRHMKKL